jgi:hypothetical protein
MNKILIAIPLIVIITISSSIILLTYQTPPNPGEPNSTSQPTNNPGTSPSDKVVSIVRYKTADFVDSQGIGTKAFSMLIPIDWKSSGDIRWILDNPAMPAFGSFKAWNPNGAEEYNYFANQAFFSSDNPMVTQTFPAGSHYFGALVHVPLGPVDALKEIAIPLFRSDVQDLKVVSEKELPELSKVIETGTDPVTGVITSTNGGKIRIEYSLNGVLMEEEMYCVIQSQNIPIQTFTGISRNINWYMTYLESFRAAKGQLDSETKTFQTISFSAKTDQNWLNKYNQVVDYLIQKQIQQIQSLGQLSNIISQTSNEISDANYAAWQQTQSVNDRLAHDFSNNILGVETYNNPFDSSTVDLPSGYSYAWANNLGEYILSDSPSYNPNTESNLNWEQMTP